MPSRGLLAHDGRMRRPHALLGGVALSLVALWILLALLLPAPANAADLHTFNSTWSTP